MVLDHGALVSLVPKVNGAIALMSWPFALYEALAKKAGAADLKEKLDLRADQLLATIVADIEESLLPYWPRKASSIIIEPSMTAEPPPSLSDAAKDAITRCLKADDPIYLRTSHIRSLARKILRFDRYCYWFIFSVAGMSAFDLLLWFISGDMSANVARAALLTPGALLIISLAAAGARQRLVQHAESQIVEE